MEHLGSLFKIGRPGAGIIELYVLVSTGILGRVGWAQPPALPTITSAVSFEDSDEKNM